MKARLILASGLLGFVIGAFVVASFQNVSAVRSHAAEQTMAASQPSDAVLPAPSPLPPVAPAPAPAPPPTPVTGTSGRTPSGAGGEIAELAARDLELPVQGVNAEALVDSFHDARDGSRQHEAIDILAPRNTPVVAVEDGTIARLFFSKAGGNTIYQFDPDGRYCYYYAHLQRYADGLKEGDAVRRGQVIGYVGTTGNAPPNTPHLHFAINRLNADRHWWQGTPIDPFPVLRGQQ
jgi:murein DD-endopeptidase MepM/ murein hydrolase activator NlpD